MTTVPASRVRHQAVKHNPPARRAGPVFIRYVTFVLAPMRRVLILTYYFPPAGGAPVQRVIKWAKYLPEHGWEPVILTVRDGAFTSIDETLEEQVASHVEVIRTRSWHPFGLYARATGRARSRAASIGFRSDRPMDWRERLARWVRTNFFIPDARVGWVPFARHAAARYLKHVQVDAIVTSGPPHSVHLAALALPKRRMPRWVADFRDPWTESHYLVGLRSSRWSTWVNRRLEDRVLHRSDAVTTVSPTCADRLRRYSGATPVDVIFNGYDEDDFTHVDARPPSKFLITYAGNMAPTQNPRVLWATIARERSKGHLQDLRIRFVGTPDISVRDDIRRLGLEVVTSFVGQVTHRQALEHMADSAVLLVVLNRVDTATAGGIVTTKFFEYLRIGWPIMAIGTPGADLETILDETSRGSFFDYEDGARMAAFLKTNYERWKRGALTAMPPDRRIMRYTRAESSRRLAGWLSSSLDQPAQT